MEVTESYLDFHPLGPSGSRVAFLTVHDEAPSAVTKRAKESVATAKLPHTQKKLAPGSGKIKLTFPSASCSFAKPAHFSHGMFSSVGRPKRSRRLCSFPSPVSRSSDADDGAPLVVLSNCKDSVDKPSF